MIRTAICILIGLGFVYLVGVFCKEKWEEFEHEEEILIVDEKPKAEVWRVSAYCPNSCCCGRWADGMTASGMPAEGKLVAAPPDIPFGTKVFIPGYGTAVVADRGGAIKGKRLDVLFPTHQEALNWGVQYLEVTFLE